MWGFSLHALDPLHVSEGGDSLVSRSGQVLATSRAKLGVITNLFLHRNEFLGFVGVEPRPIVVRPSLPYVRENWPGPIHLGPDNVKTVD